MLTITHPRPQLGRQKFIGVTFHDGVAHVDGLHPERALALQMHGYTIEEHIEGVRLEDLTVAELREIADQEGVDVPKRARKTDLIDAINAHDLPVLE